MKKRFLGLLLLPLMIGACSGQNNAKSGVSIPDYSYDSHVINHDRKTGEINTFDLLGPLDGFVVEGNFTFTWGECANADYYLLEIASTQSFTNDDPDEVYVRESNISNNKFDLTYSLPKKDILYYWKVTAINKDHRQVSNNSDTFFYKSVKFADAILIFAEGFCRTFSYGGHCKRNQKHCNEHHNGKKWA